MTGAGMMECKKALVKADGDINKAIEILREEGLATAAKKAGRIAAEGMVYAVATANGAVVVEVNAETDFVAKNDKFVEFTKDLANVVAEQAAPTALSLSSIPPMKLLLSRSSLSLARILQCRSLLQTRAT